MIVQERATSGGTPVKEFFGNGKLRDGTTAYYYTRDHLGSLREVTDAAGNVVARYAYDAYGNVTQTGGSQQFDFLYTIHFYHAESGLHLAMYRAYNPAIGRWISTDPVAKAGGVNMYAYVKNLRLNYIDPVGLNGWFYKISDKILSDSTGAFITGFGDAASFGIGASLRNSINPISSRTLDGHSTAYGFGIAAGAGVRTGLGLGQIGQMAWIANGKNTMEIAIMTGNRIPYFAYAVGSTWQHAAFRAGMGIILETEYSYTLRRLGAKIITLPILYPDNVLGTDKAKAWSCLTAAINAFIRGWIR